MGQDGEPHGEGVVDLDLVYVVYRETLAMDRKGTVY
jgi:hypothetical protein